jgi:hypothetical protein
VDKISSRTGIALADMACRFLTFNGDWWLFSPNPFFEKYLQALLAHIVAGREVGAKR